MSEQEPKKTTEAEVTNLNVGSHETVSNIEATNSTEDSWNQAYIDVDDPWISTDAPNITT